MKKLKQTFCLLLAVALLGASLCMPAAAEEAQQQPAQVVTMNGDGDIVPYAIYIQSIFPSIYKQTSTTLCFQGRVNTYGKKLTYKGTVTVQKQAGSTLSLIHIWLITAISEAAKKAFSRIRISNTKI